MNKNDFITDLMNAAKSGTLMIPKHDPNNLSTTYPDYRSVLSSSLACNLDNFIASGQYTIKEYVNNKSPKSPVYMEIIPAPNSNFSVPASGVLPDSSMASTALDRIIAVSGVIQGWHLFGEDSQIINRKISNGDLSIVGTLN